MQNVAKKCLSDLLKAVQCFNEEQNVLTYDPVITGLSQDSREVKPGDLFFARQGEKNHGGDYIAQAIEKGAAAILVEDINVVTATFEAKKIPILSIPSLSEKIGLMAAYFFDYPSRDLNIIGVTGTNGKTSCTYFIAQALKFMGHECGIIGTLGYGLLGNLQPLNNTTPDAIAIQKILAEFRAKKINYVAMEVTSHALVQNRVTGTEFAVAVLTNITRDHLDYHVSMENYAQAKRLLFSVPNLRAAIFNDDDGYGKQWSGELAERLPVYVYAMEKHSVLNDRIQQVSVNDTHFRSVGMTANLFTPWGQAILSNTRLIGHFNLSNLLCVVTVLGVFEFSLDQILSAVATLRGVPGRLEVLQVPDRPLVVVDFSHTPDALEQALTVLRAQCMGKLWCVFGCGGDRDRGKRSLMGKVAEKLADEIVLTDDNPRHEEPREIVAEIMQGIEDKSKVVVEHDRRRAIAQAIESAKSDDIVLIAGKGHETYQIVGDEKRPFGDVLEAQLVMNQ